MRARLLFHTLLAGPFFALQAMLAGCAVQTQPASPPPGQPVHAATAPCPHVPAPLEPPPPPPHSAFPQVLQPGHWDWNDGQYVWTKPSWLLLLTTQKPFWQPGGWHAQGGACVWRPGRFLLVAAAPIPSKPAAK